MANRPATIMVMTALQIIILCSYSTDWECRRSDGDPRSGRDNTDQDRHTEVFTKECRRPSWRSTKPYCLLKVGSSRSLNASPRRLTESVVTKMSVPGRTESHHARLRLSRPSPSS